MVNFEKLVEKSVLTHFFPLDTREKIYRPLVGVEAERARGPSKAVAKPGTAHRSDQKLVSKLCECMAVDEPTAMQTFISFCKGIRRDYPVRDIRDYYGEKIAYYFIFVMHLLHPIFGLPAFAFVGVGVSQRFLELQVRTD